MRTPENTVQASKCIEKLAAVAASDNVQLMVFPEALLGGYPRWAAFGAVIGGRSAAGRGELLVADLDLDDITRGRYDFDTGAATKYFLNHHRYMKN